MRMAKENDEAMGAVVAVLTVVLIAVSIACYVSGSRNSRIDTETRLGERLASCMLYNDSMLQVHQCYIETEE